MTPDSTTRKHRPIQFLLGLAALLIILLILAPQSHTAAQDNTTQLFDASIYDDGQWVEMGEGSASGGGISNTAEWTGIPSLAFDHNGLPVIAWCHQFSPFDGIHVRRWNGQSWEKWGGTAGSGSIVEDSEECSNISLATGTDGFPIIAWDGSGEIYVRRWSGASWAEMGAGSATGGGISSSSEFAHSPILAVGPDGVPVVAWSDNYKDIFVRRWNAVSWVEMGQGSAAGGGISNTPGGSSPSSMAIGPDSHPIVAWFEYPGYDSEIYARLWNGAIWVNPGGRGVARTAGYSFDPSAAVAPDGTPIIAWEDTSDGDPEIYVRRWDGLDWVAMGTGSDSGGGISDNNDDSFNPSVATAPDGSAIIAWEDYSPIVPEIYVRRWNGEAWVEMGTHSASGRGISYNPGTSNLPLVAVSPDGTAIVTWVDFSDEGENPDIYVLRWQPKGNYELRLEAQSKATYRGPNSPVTDTAQLLNRLQLPVIVSDYPPFTTPREIEPNDTYMQANGPLNFAATYLGSFTAESDIYDYYYFKLPVAQTLSARLAGIPVGDNIDLYLRDQAQQILSQSSNPHNMDEEITINLPPGLYYLQVQYQP